MDSLRTNQPPWGSARPDGPRVMKRGARGEKAPLISLKRPVRRGLIVSERNTVLLLLVTELLLMSGNYMIAIDF